MSNVDPVQAAIQAAIAKAASQSNHAEAKGGGGDYEPPKAGLTVVTLIGYLEIGVHKHEIPNKPAYESNDVQLIFELNGGVNKAELVDGKLIAKRITVTEKLSQNEKAHYFKLFNAMNYDGQCTHGAQLVGKHFLADVFVDKGKNGKMYAGLKGPNGYTVRAPIVIKGDPLDPDNQQKVVVPAPARAQADNKVFLWDYASKEMWDSIYIDGEYEAKAAVPAQDGKPAQPAQEARSKNVLQAKIRSALNFQGSPIQKILGDEALNLEESPLTGNPAASESVATSSESATQNDTTNPTGAAGSDPLTEAVAEIDSTIEANDDPLAGLV